MCSMRLVTNFPAIARSPSSPAKRGCHSSTVATFAPTEAVRYLEGAIDGALLTHARAWAATCELVRAPKRIGTVDQRADVSVVGAHEERWRPLARFLARVRDAVGDSRWQPNEATVMHYEEGTGGISAHRDHRCFVYAVAIVSLCGESTLEILDDTRTRRVASWRCRPGDVVVLRGPEPSTPEEVDLRPVHAVSDAGPGGRRSLTLRMDSRV